MRLLFDCETNGLLHQLDRIHCLNIRDVDTRKSYRFRRNDTEDTIEEGVRMLHEADEIIDAAKASKGWLILSLHNVVQAVVDELGGPINEASHDAITSAIAKVEKKIRELEKKVELYKRQDGIQKAEVCACV